MKTFSPQSRVDELLLHAPQIAVALNDQKIIWAHDDCLEDICRTNKLAFAILSHIIQKHTKLQPAPNNRYFKTHRPESIQKIIAVHSGKGGVGKTFISTALAVYLSKKHRTALLDLDIDCPNVFKILDINEEIKADSEKRILPIQRGNLKILSLAGIARSEDEPIMWRGPIMAKAIEQLIHDTNWGELEVLIIDLPPGTSDVPMTLMQMVKPDGVIAVTTPHASAQIDCAKSIAMARKLQVPVLGVVENMTGDIFGTSDGARFQKKHDIDYFGSLELSRTYAEFNAVRDTYPMALKQLVVRIMKKIFS